MSPDRFRPKRVGQTPEDRIRRQYRAKRRTIHLNDYPVSWLWMGLARQWKRPIREIKRIVKR